MGGYLKDTLEYHNNTLIMKTIEIKGSLRKELGKKDSKLIRKSGNVPCVMYMKENNVHFFAHENSFHHLIYTHEAHLVKLSLDDQEYKAVLHDMQFHPVTDRLIHADFVQIFDNKPVIIDVPVTMVGEAPGVKAGGKLIVKKRHLKVLGLAENLPEDLVVDVSNLNIAHSIKVGDLSYDKIELIDPKITTVVTVATSRVALKTEEEEAAEAAAAAAAAEGAEEAAETPGTEKDKDKEKGKEKEKEKDKDKDRGKDKDKEKKS
jgi:large subunit ribosomal protein L25